MLDITCQMIHMKCQALFSLKKKMTVVCFRIFPGTLEANDAVLASTHSICLIDYKKNYQNYTQNLSGTLTFLHVFLVILFTGIYLFIYLFIFMAIFYGFVPFFHVNYFQSNHVTLCN